MKLKKSSCLQSIESIKVASNIYFIPEEMHAYAKVQGRAEDKTSFNSVYVRKKAYALKYDSKYTVKASWRQSMGEVHLYFAGQNDCSVLWPYIYVVWNYPKHFRKLTYLFAEGSRSITWLFLTQAHKLLGS